MKKLVPITENRKGIVKAENRSRQQWTQEDEARLRELHRKGYSMKGIASILGRTVMACAKELTKLRQESKGAKQRKTTPSVSSAFCKGGSDNYREELLAIYHVPTATETYQMWCEFSFNVSNGLQI